MRLNRGPVQQSPASRSQPYLKHGVTNGILFASDSSNNLVDCYTTRTFNPPSFGSITGLAQPQGLASRGTDLTIANTGALNVLVYHGCSAQLVRTMSEPTGYPVGVAIDQSGNTYVTNIYDFNGGGEVREYSPRSKLGVQLGDPNLAEDYFVAVDAIGDIFVDGITATSHAEVDWRPAHCTSGKTHMSA